LTPKTTDTKKNAKNHAHLLSLASQWLGHSKQTTLFCETPKTSKKQQKKTIA
jgi:bisphosphoglycerate-independent phosphoglycerate mutase (AlkP superfamily)